MIKKALCLLTIATAASTLQLDAAKSKKPRALTVCPRKTADLKAAMRKLWEDHVTYTRNYIISALAGLGDADAVAQRLMKNQDDIGNAIAPFYGKEAGNKLAQLLRDHIAIAADVVKAAKAGNADNLKKEQDRWHANADDIANFLGDANPHWTKKNLKDMLYKHLALTTDEVVNRLKKNWNGDIAAYDKGHEHMLMFSDVLIDGIAKQFPEKFECLCKTGRQKKAMA